MNEGEAAIVREIYDGYLRHRSPAGVIEELRANGRAPKAHMTKAGTVGVTGAWTIAKVFRILKSPIYVGKVGLGASTYDGEHEAIVDPERFEHVRAALGGRAPVTKKTARRGYLLRGLLRSAVCGSAMTPASAYKGEREYRYYRCAKRDREGRDACATRPLSARAVESYVIERLRKIATDENVMKRVTSPWTADTLAAFERLWEMSTPAGRARLIGCLIRRVVIDERASSLRIQLLDQPADGEDAA